MKTSTSNGTGDKLANSTSDSRNSLDHKNSEPLLEDQGNGAVKMEKNLGLMNAIALIAGTVIGSGIFVSPTGILGISNSIGTSLFIWLGCGGLALCGALCYAELGTMLRKSGAEYAYIKCAFGSLPAFLLAWTSVLVIKPAIGAILSLIFAEYLLKPFFPDCTVPLVAMKLVACLCLSK